MKLLQEPYELDIYKPMSCLIYGQPGIGKTTIALSAPNPVIIDLDNNGVCRVNRRFRKPSLQVKDYQQIIDLINSEEIDPFETIVIDTVGDLIDKIGDWLAKSNNKIRQSDGKLSISGWGAVKSQFNLFLKSIIDKQKNVIFIAHDKDEKDGEKKIFRPDIPGSSGKDIIKKIELMGYMEASGNKRTISFTPTERFYAKNSLDLPPVISVPDIDSNSRNSFFTDYILNEITNKRVLDNEMSIEYDELISSQANRIENATTHIDLNVLLEVLKNEKTIWDSARCWREKLNERSKELNVVFNKETKAFEPCN